MTARPADLPEWASNTNYDSGPDAGTVTRVKPSAGELGNGFINGVANSPDAQAFNWIGGSLSDWVTYLAELGRTAVYTVSGTNVADGTKFTLTEDSADTGYTLSSDEVEVDDEGTYLVTWNLSVRTDDASSPYDHSILIKWGSSGQLVHHRLRVDVNGGNGQTLNGSIPIVVDNTANHFWVECNGEDLDIDGGGTSYFTVTRIR